MEKSKNSKDKEKRRIVAEELSKFSKLIEGHKKLLDAISRL